MKGSHRGPVSQQAWQDPTEEEPSLENRVSLVLFEEKTGDCAQDRRPELCLLPGTEKAEGPLGGMGGGAEGTLKRKSECVPKALLLVLLSE